jgi:type IV pilus assembly protein PilQ
MVFLARVMMSLLSMFLVLGSVGVSAAQQAQESCLTRLPTDRVTLNLRDASTQTTLRLLAQQYRVNMVVTDEVKGTVTLDFFKVPAREVFQAILDAGNLRCAVTGEILRVSSSTRLKAEEDERTKAREALLRLEADTRKKIIEAKQAEDEAKDIIARGPIREETIRLRYADAEEVAKTIQGILGLRPGAFSTTPVPLPQLSQLYVPSPPLQIPSEPPAPQTAPVQLPSLSSDALSKGLTVGAYKATNSVFIRYYSRDLDRIKKLIQESLDIPLPQIQIAAQMVITTLNALEQIGVQWGGAVIGKSPVGGGTALVTQGFADSGVRTGPGTPAQGNFTNNSGFNQSQLLPTDPSTGLPVGGNLVNLPTSLLPTLVGATPAGGLLLGLIGSNFNLNLAIQALEVQGKARTLAEPKAITVENAKATISRGFEVPYTSTPTQGVSQVQFKEALLKLEVTPRLIREDGENKIRLKVAFDNDAPDFTQSVQGNPSIFKRHQDTEVVIREGQRLVIGGVTNDVSSKTVRQVPVLGNVPVLGWLFKSREINSQGEELIVILTPSVVSHSVPAPRR